MTSQILDWLKEVRSKYLPKTGMALDIGSMDINGSARQFFDGWFYTGVDMLEGKGVDVVLNGHDLKQVYKPESFDVVLCLETLEHDDMFWITLKNIQDLTKQGGHMIITVPTFKFPLHRHPKDYYRFGEDVFTDVFYPSNAFKILEMKEVIGKGGNPGVVGIGRKL